MLTGIPRQAPRPVQSRIKQQPGLTLVRRQNQRTSWFIQGCKPSRPTDGVLFSMRQCKTASQQARVVAHEKEMQGKRNREQRTQRGARKFLDLQSVARSFSFSRRISSAIRRGLRPRRLSSLQPKWLDPCAFCVYFPPPRPASP